MESKENEKITPGNSSTPEETNGNAPLNPKNAVKFF